MVTLLAGFGIHKPWLFFCFFFFTCHTVMMGFGGVDCLRYLIKIGSLFVMKYVFQLHLSVNLFG